MKTSEMSSAQVNPAMLAAKVDKTQIPQVYRTKVAVYDYWGRLTESKAQQRCLELAKIQDGESILEVAVGTGLTFVQLLQRNPSGRNEGLDLTPEMLAQAKIKAARTEARHYNLQQGDAYKLPYENDTFDLLINNYMFDLLPEADFSRVIAEFKRVLRPGGRLVLVNMAQGGRWYNRIWDKIYQIQPSWLGGCRGVSLMPTVQAAGFQDLYREFISQMTFPSEVIVGIVDG